MATLPLSLLLFSAVVLPANVVCALLGLTRLRRTPASHLLVTVASYLPWVVSAWLSHRGPAKETLERVLQLIGDGGMANLIPIADLGVGARRGPVRAIAVSVAVLVASAAVTWSHLHPGS